MILRGENQRTQRKTCSSATLSTTSHIWTDLGANTRLCGERPVTDSLSHGKACIYEDNMNNTNYEQIFKYYNFC
jgi:hypothetical protein